MSMAVLGTFAAGTQALGSKSACAPESPEGAATTLTANSTTRPAGGAHISHILLLHPVFLTIAQSSKQYCGPRIRLDAETQRCININNIKYRFGDLGRLFGILIYA